MTSHPFGTGWRFGPASAGSDQPGFDDSGFAEVTLPHTVVPLSRRDWDPSAWERVWMYRKRFDAPPGAERRRVFVDFAAAMTRATVTLNGVTPRDAGSAPVTLAPPEPEPNDMGAAFMSFELHVRGIHAV